MLEFAEKVLKEIRKHRQHSQDIVLSGGISDMERYRFMMGRLEGLSIAEESVRELLKNLSEEFDEDE
jgi:hypothetical protein